MKIVFTKHAEENFRRFRKHKVSIPRRSVLEAVNNPEHIDKKSDKPRIIASKNINERLVLRVVYKKVAQVLKRIRTV